MPKVFERVRFTLIVTPCCHTMLCYVNPRMPNYCSECGERLFAMKKNPEAILFTDYDAQLKYNDGGAL
jgi:hypothetical protein